MPWFVPLMQLKEENGTTVFFHKHLFILMVLNNESTTPPVCNLTADLVQLVWMTAESYAKTFISRTGHKIHPSGRGMRSLLQSYYRRTL